MIDKREYSAGAVKFSFWFNEFRKMVSLLQSGKTTAEIKTLAQRDNLFSAATPMRSRQIVNTVLARAAILPDSFFAIFASSSLETQKHIVLVSVMLTDCLFYDFMNEVYREKLMTGDMILTDADMRIFFLDKQRESEKVAGWKDETLIRLRRCYKTYLAEAGLLERGAGERKIIKPLVDERFAALLAESDLQPVVHVFKGMR